MEDEKKGEQKKAPASKKRTYTILLIVGLFVILISSMFYYLMPSSTGMFFFNNKNSSGLPKDITSFKYKDFYFAKTDSGLWSTALPNFEDVYGNPYVVSFHSTPYDVKNIPVYGNVTSFLPSNETYVTTDMSNVEGNAGLILGISELSFKLASSAFVIQGQTLFNPKITCDQDNDPACNMTEIVNCEKDKDKKVIYFLEGNTPSITATGNCIVLSAKGNDYIKVVDRLMYSWYGVMD